MSGTAAEGVGLGTLATIVAAGLGVLAKHSERPLVVDRGRRPPLPPTRPEVLAARAARRLNESSALLSLAVLADSGVEHYRGMFHNKAMILPLAVSAATLVSSLHGAHDKTGEAHLVRRGVATAAAVTGVVGSFFHLYNVGKRDGGFSWLNLFYGAPLGAPYSLILAGVMDVAAEHVRDSRHGPIRLFGLRAGPTLAAITAAGIAGTVAEAALLHFRGAFHDPFMLTPVTIPPIAATLIAKAGMEAAPRWNRFTRVWLWITAAVGFVGAGFHVYGVSRNMGGWRNWSQNVLNGPPIPAPPAFTALALAGLAALDLLQERS